MSWYSSPIQPLDPVIQSQTPKPPIRYMRDNFAGTGQNSYVLPPAQDQSMWQALTNVMPITQGVLNPRWGYDIFTGIAGVPSTIATITTIVKTMVHGTTALVTCNTTAGLIPGQLIIISGNTYAFFNGLRTVVSVISPTQFTILSFSPVPLTGTGGIVQITLANNTNRLFDFQSDLLGTRAIIGTGLDNVIAYNEAGSVYNANIFTPVATSGIIRSATSRDYQYFCDGVAVIDPTTHRSGDSLKWNGDASGGVTNIGISPTDVTPNTITGAGGTGVIEGPITAATAIDVPTAANNAWTNPSGCLTNSFAAPAYVNLYQNWQSDGNGNFLLITDARTSDSINASNFTFASFPSPQVYGIQVALTFQTNLFPYTDNPTGAIYVQLLNNGTPVGAVRNAPISIDGNVYTVTLGSSTDLWGTSFVPSDLTNGSLGVLFYFNGNFTLDDSFNGGNVGFQVQDSYITMTVFGAASPGTSSTSGAGVGIAGSVSGDISLVLGRVYYLIPNNSLTGHFGDLSAPSASTGPIASGEFNLALATYNDPQVDFKYVLATADGGDPSILYQVQVLAPGFIITSWVIDGSDNVTFTGTWQDTQYSTGATFLVGGLNHGAYMNGQTLTVVSTSGTTLVSTFTHGADSATEGGIGGNLTYRVPNDVFFVVDDMPDAPSGALNGLVDSQPMLFTDTFGNEYGVTLNDPPQNGTLLLKHQGRLWMAGIPGSTHSVFFSKSVTELTLPDGFIAGKYEESWPGSNYFDVSDGAESVSGLLTDGTTLYIGTQSHIRRLLGNSPANFQEPAIVHPEVGLINQEVWQITFLQGAPAGSIWMTPDFRVIQSDFNTYVDIGTPIQDILNKLQPTAPSLAHAAFVADGEYELYILAVPYQQSTYCDTHLVFDLRARQWFVWQPAGGSLSLLYNVTQLAVPQWLFINGSSTAINIYASSATTDNGTAFNTTATTTWLHHGEPTRRKMLNEVQVYGNTAMTMTVHGANNAGDFLAPRTIVYNRTLRRNPFDVWVLYLTGAKTRHRYYQYTFQAPASAIPLLGSYSISVMPLDDI